MSKHPSPRFRIPEATIAVWGKLAASQRWTVVEALTVVANRLLRHPELAAQCLSPVRGDRGTPELELVMAEGTVPPSIYPPEFEVAWKAYPKRPNNPKMAALLAWRRRLKEGYSADQLTAGVHRYAAWVAENVKDPVMIKQASTFFGPGLPFLEAYERTPVAVDYSFGRKVLNAP